MIFETIFPVIYDDYKKIIKTDINRIKKWSSENKLPHMLTNQLELLHKQIIAFRHIQMNNYFSTQNSIATHPEEQKIRHQNYRKLYNVKVDGTLIFL